VYLPPVRRGDLASAIAVRPKIIAIIDGLFFENAAVGHREVLSALRAGIRVIGASSMGALRAAELASFGMEGIGVIFSRYQDGTIESDDEVALICDPETNTALSEPLVNIRLTLEKAGRDGIIDGEEFSRLLASSKSRYYPDRTWGEVIGSGAISPEKAGILRVWLAENKVDQKKEDAKMSLKYIRDILDNLRE
jgi:hypothetical protein